MPPKKKSKVAATSGTSLALSRVQGDDEEENPREIAMSLGYGRISATFNPKKRRYQQTITYESSTPFDLTSATITAGVFTGRQIVLLEAQAPPVAATFRFTDLPAELRNMVYAELFGLACKIDVRMTKSKTYVSYYNSDGAWLRASSPALNILATCRSVHDEAASLFYGSVRFHLTSPHLTRFLTSFPMHTKYIRIVQVKRCSGSTKRAMVLLSAIKDLEILRIEEHDYYNGFRRSHWRGGGYYAHMLKPLLQALQKKVNDREAVLRKIVFLDESRLTADTADLARRATRFEQFRVQVFTYLKDRPEPELGNDDAPSTASGATVVVRRDTGRPKRSAVKAISYAEVD